ncbi:hypothetical protein LCGC14_1045930 [marine sediment metagenome]|uniref:Uncharacterized protein n=1 Tax=marine sediment metagenome TaxID=412755 RepID=A0A0F9QWF3_9ZZZZ
MENNIDTQPRNCGAVINLLLIRWSILYQYAALEKLQTRKSAQPTNILAEFNFAQGKPVLQIEIIKLKIIELLPEASFIFPEFQDEADLAQDDFLEIYLEHQMLAIKKVREVLDTLGIK